MNLLKFYKNQSYVKFAIDNMKSGACFDRYKMRDVCFSRRSF
jgi:hypothetical protein